MNNIFNRPRRQVKPRGRRKYDENGYPVDELPSDERPRYSNDENEEFSLKGNYRNASPLLGDKSGGGELYGESSTGENPKNGGDSYDRPKAAPAPKGGETEPQTEQEQTESDYDLDAGLSDYYDRLYERLRAYGVTSIPTLEALYGLFESFLRPSIDEAIRARNRQGAYNMAELDADAYSRGMGGSSYLSSMKAREQDDIASDVMGLEAKYSASMAEYLYKALTQMQELEASLARTQMQIAAANASSASHGSSGSSGSHSSSSSHSSSGSQSSESESEGPMPYGHNKNGAYFDGVWYEGDFSYMSNPADFNDYANYIMGLSAGERYLLFTSSKREWRMRRWQMQYNLSRFDYEDLYNMYYTEPSTGGGGGGGSTQWHEMLY